MEILQHYNDSRNKCNKEILQEVPHLIYPQLTRVSTYLSYKGNCQVMPVSLRSIIVNSCQTINYDECRKGMNKKA